MNGNIYHMKLKRDPVCRITKPGMHVNLLSALAHMELRGAEHSMYASCGDDAALLRSARRVLTCRERITDIACQPFRNVRCCDIPPGHGDA